MASAAVKNVKKLSLDDVTCPICLLILIEPVTMPCNHELCSPCFEANLSGGESSLFCPICRLRIGSWARKCKRNGTLVNKARWKEIKKAFPKKVKHRLETDESSDIEEELNKSFPQHLAEPGEIHEEYEAERRKFEEEVEHKHKEEEEASLMLIAELQRQQQAEEKEKEVKQSAKVPAKSGLLDRYVQRLPVPSTSSLAPPSPQRTHPSYPYMCYTPTSHGKLITADMVTKDKYPYIDLPHPTGPAPSTSRVSLADPSRPDPLGPDTRGQSDVTFSLGGEGDGATVRRSESSPNVAFKSKSAAKGGVGGKGKAAARRTASSRVVAEAAGSEDRGIRNWLVDCGDTEIRSRSPSEESKDSISKELNYFRPVRVFPKTPSQHALVVTTPIHSTKPEPMNWGMEPVNLMSLGGSPLLLKHVQNMKEQHQRQVESQSRATCTSPPPIPRESPATPLRLSLLDLCQQTGALEDPVSPPSPPPLPADPEDLTKASSTEDESHSVFTVTQVDFHSELTRSDAACMPSEGATASTGFNGTDVVHQWLEAHPMCTAHAGSDSSAEFDMRLLQLTKRSTAADTVPSSLMESSSLQLSATSGPTDTLLTVDSVGVSNGLSEDGMTSFSLSSAGQLRLAMNNQAEQREERGEEKVPPGTDNRAGRTLKRRSSVSSESHTSKQRKRQNTTQLTDCCHARVSYRNGQEHAKSQSSDNSSVRVLHTLRSRTVSVSSGSSSNTGAGSRQKSQSSVPPLRKAITRRNSKTSPQTSKLCKTIARQTRKSTAPICISSNSTTLRRTVQTSDSRGEGRSGGATGSYRLRSRTMSTTLGSTPSKPRLTRSKRNGPSSGHQTRSSSRRTRPQNKENSQGNGQASIVMYCTAVTHKTAPLALQNYALEGLPSRLLPKDCPLQGLPDRLLSKDCRLEGLLPEDWRSYKVKHHQVVTSELVKETGLNVMDFDCELAVHRRPHTEDCAWWSQDEGWCGGLKDSQRNSVSGYESMSHSETMDDCQVYSHSELSELCSQQSEHDRVEWFHPTVHNSETVTPPWVTPLEDQGNTTYSNRACSIMSSPNTSNTMSSSNGINTLCVYSSDGTNTTPSSDGINTMSSSDAINTMSSSNTIDTMSSSDTTSSSDGINTMSRSAYGNTAVAVRVESRGDDLRCESGDVQRGPDSVLMTANGDRSQDDLDLELARKLQVQFDKEARLLYESSRRDAYCFRRRRGSRVPAK